MTRVVAVHIHLFKNAGSSVDRALSVAFGDRWVSWDGDKPNQLLSQSDVASFVQSNPAIEAISSHQIRPPLPVMPEVELVPLVLLRHPVDRIRSAYDFERRQRVDTPSARAAASMNMQGWIDFHRGRNSSQVSNFQVRALTEIRNRRWRPKRQVEITDHVASAVGFLERQPVFGLVERYEDSLRVFERHLRRHFPEVELGVDHVNRTSVSRSLEERIDGVRERLGTVAFDRLVADNREDLELYRWGTNRFDELWCEQP